MRSRPPLGSVLALGALAVFSVWITWRAKAMEMGTRLEGAPSRLIGKPAPAFELESLDGRRISLAGYRGKTLVTTFWASWCGPCRLELPVLVKFYREQHRANQDFEILAISVDATRDAAQGAAKTMQLPFPVLLDSDNRVSDSYSVDAIPALFVIDKAGKVIFSHVGFVMGIDAMIAQQLAIPNYNPMGGAR